MIIWLSAIQRKDKILCFLFLVGLYELCNLFIKFLFKEKSGKSQGKSKYKYQDINSSSVDDLKDIQKIDFDVSEAIDDARNAVEARKDRIASYDFREFNGRKNVNWEEVYDYLWLQCRYKGIRMWSEYMNELIERGVIDENDKKLVFKKAGNYIPWNPRPDLEAQHEFEKEKERKRKNAQNKWDESVKEYNYKLYKNGLMSKEAYEYATREIVNEGYLKSFFYDEYLKKKGYI